MSEDQATEITLVDLLRDIPCDYRGEWPIQWAEDGTPTGHAMYPIGLLAHKAADRIAELEQPWIPVSERLPENAGGNPLYLVFEKERGKPVRTSILWFDKSMWASLGVTHWMPLPATDYLEAANE